MFLPILFFCFGVIVGVIFQGYVNVLSCVHVLVLIDDLGNLVACAMEEKNIRILG